MTISNTFKAPDMALIDQADGTSNKLSATFYDGEKEDQIARYSYNYKLTTTTIKTVSVFYYKAVPVRADDASVTADDAMTMSKTFKTTDIALIDEADGTSNKLSETFYVGEKGDEIADYSYNYKLTTTTIKTVSVLY